VELSKEDLEALDKVELGEGNAKRLIKPDWPAHLLKFDDWN